MADALAEIWTSANEEYLQCTQVANLYYWFIEHAYLVYQLLTSFMHI